MTAELPTISMNDDFESSGDQDLSIVCASRHQSSFLLFCIFPSLAIVINLVVLAAVLRKARKLMRQNHIYAHVSSTLIGNVLFALLALFQLLSLYFNFGGFPHDPDPSRWGMVNENASKWWPFHKAFLCGMFVIMCGNIGLLIDSIRHNTCSTLRTAAGHRIYAKDGPAKWKKKCLTRRQRSNLQITLLWVIPLIYVAIPPAGWNCANICQCLSECFPANHTYNSSDYMCSRVFPPMTNSWMSVVVLSWFCGVLLTIWLLKRSVSRVKNMWSHSFAAKRYENKGSDHAFDGAEEHQNSMKILWETSRPVAKSSASFSVKGNNNNNDYSSREKAENESFKDPKYYTLGANESLCSGTSQKAETGSDTLIKGKGNERATHSRTVGRLRSTRATTFSLRYVILLTFFFILCTAPTMALLSVDILIPRINFNMVVLNSCLLCPFVYCYLCPFILVKCLPGVKASLSALFLSVYSTSK